MKTTIYGFPWTAAPLAPPINVRMIRVMPKWMLCLTFAAFLTAGCSPQPPAVVASTEAIFCDVEEKRRFTQEEINWRAEHAPWNLRRDYKTNLTYERECEAAE